MAVQSIVNKGLRNDASLSEVITAFNALLDDYHRQIPTKKIADGSVTEDKLSFTVPTSPAIVSYSANPAGFASLSTNKSYYILLGNMVILSIAFEGISNAAYLRFTLPYKPKYTFNCGGAYVGSGSSNRELPGLTSLSSGSQTAYCCTNHNWDGWSTSGNKAINAIVIYEKE